MRCSLPHSQLPFPCGAESVPIQKNFWVREGGGVVPEEGGRGWGNPRDVLE